MFRSLRPPGQGQASRNAFRNTVNTDLRNLRERQSVSPRKSVLAPLLTRVNATTSGRGGLSQSQPSSPFTSLGAFRVDLEHVL
jgi:hypothetical protein